MQMATTHQAAMMMARRLNRVDNTQQPDSAERALNKTARNFAAQMDTLKRYRSKGQQTVRVERVTVEPGAQAVVGNVNHGGRGRDEKWRRPHASGKCCAQMQRKIKAQRQAMPRPCRSGLGGLPDARRRRQRKAGLCASELETWRAQR